VRCPYCSSSVIVPEELRPKTPDGRISPPDPARVFVTAEQMEEIKRLLRDGQKIEAIKIYRQATTLGLKEAKDAVEAIQAADPELKNRPPSASRGASKTSVIVAGLFFFAIASIFPLVFFPMGVEAWQARQYAGAIFSFLGAIIWALVWGGIGWIILFSKP
jgi:hypothetical protein